jgi:hypothetical protein
MNALFEAAAYQRRKADGGPIYRGHAYRENPARRPACSRELTGLNGSGGFPDRCNGVDGLFAFQLKCELPPAQQSFSAIRMVTRRLPR